jgi:hypothetical protein
MATGETKASSMADGSISLTTCNGLTASACFWFLRFGTICIYLFSSSLLFYTSFYDDLGLDLFALHRSMHEMYIFMNAISAR